MTCPDPADPHPPIHPDSEEKVMTGYTLFRIGLWILTAVSLIAAVAYLKEINS